MNPSQVGIFLDRDGTINEEVDFLINPAEVRLIDGAAEAIRRANEQGWKVFVVTNQSGIARGLITEEQLALVHEELVAQLKAHGARIDAIYYCPHHPELGNGKYRIECTCRKPMPGMLERAAVEFDIDLRRSFVIGDRMIDVQAGNAVGAKSVLVLTGYGEEELKLCATAGVAISHVAENIAQALEFVHEKVLRTTSL